jgi:hypothetical protein
VYVIDDINKLEILKEKKKLVKSLRKKERLFNG